MKRPARVASQLSESLHRQLNTYALTATAAGVGALALAHPADAKFGDRLSSVDADIHATKMYSNSRI